MSRTLAVLLAVGLLGIWGAGAVGAATLNVGAKQKYTTIQSAINAANNGDIVKVCPGTYTENIDFKGKAITVTGSAPTNPAMVVKTIINGNQQGSVVTFQSGEKATSVLSGFTVTNGSASSGGGVYCSNSSPTLAHNTISHNWANYGGGVDCESSSPTLTNNTISGNWVVHGGGGVNCYKSSPTLTNNTISGNSAEGGFRDAGYGGGVCCASSSPTLINNTISGNSAGASESGDGGEGGGVYCYQSSPTLTNDTISGNSAATGGGVYCTSGSSPTLTNDTISGNSASDGGGVYCTSGSSPIIKNTIVTGNTQGGGLYVYDPTSSKPVITYCDFYGDIGGNYLGWPNQTGKNGNIAVSAQFADPASGDFHLKSQYGRWNPSTKTWVLDTVTSPCIDAGDPTSAFNLEPEPNGGRINMGKGGDTINASKSPAPAPALALTVTAAAVATTGGSAQIMVTLASAASVEATVLNVAGREIAVLPAQDLAAGVSAMRWDGRSALGTRVPAGRYLVRVTARTPDGGQAQALVALELRR